MSKAMEYARRFFAGSVWADHVKLSEGGVAAALQALHDNPMAYVEINEHGAIGGVITPLWFSPETLVAAELFWYCETPGEGAKLRQRFEAWAKESGAKYVQMSCMINEHEDRLRRTLASQGYTAKEIGFIKDL